MQAHFREVDDAVFREGLDLWEEDLCIIYILQSEE